MNVSTPRILTAAALLAASLAACADQPTEPPVGPGPEPAPLPLGVYQLSFNAGGDVGAASTGVVPVPLGPSEALNPTSAGLGFELVSQHMFTEGVRGQGGQRFVMATFRVRNSTGAPVTNVTLIPAIRTSTIANTPFASMTLFDGSQAPQEVAPLVVPSGAVTLGDDSRMRSRYPDVLQVFTEAEVAAIPLPAGTSSLFPYGFMVNNPSTPNRRTLPVAANANDFSGMVTLAFRYPLQATAAGDPFAFNLQFMAVQDTETRLTESVEERQDTAGVRRARERATALGATTVTVLAGSPAADPFVTDYPGQRQICLVRTAGPPGAPTRRIMAPGSYTEVLVYRPGELTDPCLPYFRSGTPAPANYGMAYTVKVWAMDRYGNGTSLPVDTMTLSSTDGTAVMPAPKALVSGSANMTLTYTTYGLSTLRARGRRMRGESPVFVNGMTRTWGGATSTAWLTNGNWTNGMHPGSQDSVIIPGDRPNYPLLVQNTAVPGITMVDGSTAHPFINLSSFDFTVTGNLVMGNNGTFTGTGRLILAGNVGTFGGGISNVNVRNLRITGSYTATSNANVTGGRIVVQGGRLRSHGYRIRVRPS